MHALKPCHRCNAFPSIDIKSTDINGSKAAIATEYKIRCCHYEQLDYLSKDVTFQLWNEYVGT